MSAYVEAQQELFDKDAPMCSIDFQNNPFVLMINCDKKMPSVWLRLVSWYGFAARFSRLAGNKKEARNRKGRNMSNERQAVDWRRHCRFSIYVAGWQTNDENECKNVKRADNGSPSKN